MTDVQALLDATPAGGTVRLPVGELRVPQGTRWVVPRPMTVEGHGCTVVVEGQTVANLFDAAPLTGGVLAFRGLTVTAPAAVGTTVDSVISWQRSKTPGGRLIVEDSTILGAWNAAVTRSGGGAVEIRRCTLEGWSAPIKCFESHQHGSGHTLTVEDSTLMVASSSSASDSIGAYVHPHIETCLRRVTGKGFGRWVVYANGSMPGASRWTLDEVTADNCSLVQAPGGQAELLMRGCREIGTQRNGGSLIRGRVISVGSEWAGQNGHSLPPGIHDLTYIGDTFTRSAGYALVAGRGVGGSIRVVDSAVCLSGTGRFLLTTADADPDLDVSAIRSTIGAASGHTKLAQVTVLRQGELHLIGTTLPAPADAIAPGRVVTWGQ